MSDEETPSPPSEGERTGQEPSSLKGLTMALGIEPAKPGEDSLLGCDIGGVEIIRLIAEGGMGRVYEGKQEKPNRTVAVKVMRPGLTSPSSPKRFEYEADVLGRLQHPGIAHIYSVGVHRVGNATVPYFVMEYIADARSLTQYAEEIKLPTRQRLDLFRSVCEAVAHGHQKGVIHRDLKPSNILVDATGQPKVIDFGVARATDSDMALTTMQTDVGQLIGTLQYMSPEQFDADPNDIDIRSDVYALGVILYELLAGKMPYDVKKKAIYEVMRIVKEEEPTPLSSFNRALKGDVAVIAGKCLEKDRNKRYSSASELGSDVGRYLSGEGISASAPNFVDGLARLARKHRVAATAVAAVFASLLITVVGIAYFAAQAEQSRKRAVANEAASIAEKDKSRRILQFFLEAFQAADPDKIGRQVTIAEVLTAAATTTPTKFANDPLTEAEIQITISDTLRSLGLFDAANKCAEHALAKTQLESVHNDENAARLRARATATLAHIRLFQHRLYDAERLFHQAEELAKSAMPAELGFQLEVLNGSIRTLIRSHRKEDALQVLAKAEQLCKAHGVSDTLQAITILQHRGLALLCSLELDAPSVTAALGLLECALQKSRLILGDEHTKTSEILSDVAICFRRLHRYPEAEQFYREALLINEKVLGPNHWDTAKVLANLGVLYRNMGRLKEAEDLIDRSTSILQQQFGDQYPGLWLNQASLGMIAIHQGNDGRAEKLFRQAIAGCQRIDPGDPGICRIQDGLFDLILWPRGDKVGIANELARSWSRGIHASRFQDSRLLSQLHRLSSYTAMTGLLELPVQARRDQSVLLQHAPSLSDHEKALWLQRLATLACLEPTPSEAEKLARAAVTFHENSCRSCKQMLAAACSLGDALSLQGRHREAYALLQKYFAEAEEGAAVSDRVRAALMLGDLETVVGDAEPPSRFYFVAREQAKAALGVQKTGLTISFFNPAQTGNRQNYLCFLLADAEARINTLRDADAALLVLYGRTLMERRSYAAAEAMMRGAMRLPGGDELRAEHKINELLTLLGRKSSGIDSH